MSIHEETAEAIKQAVRVLENKIAEAEATGLRVDMHYRSNLEEGFRYLETVIVLPILNFP